MSLRLICFWVTGVLRMWELRLLKTYLLRLLKSYLLWLRLFVNLSFLLSNNILMRLLDFFLLSNNFQIRLLDFFLHVFLHYQLWYCLPRGLNDRIYVWLIFLSLIFQLRTGIRIPMIVFDVWVVLRIHDAALNRVRIVAFWCLGIYGLLDSWTDWTFESYFCECFLASFVYSIHGAQLWTFKSQSLILVENVSLPMFTISILVRLMPIGLLCVLLPILQLYVFLLILPLYLRNILIELLLGILLFVLVLYLIMTNDKDPRELAALFIIFLFLFFRNFRFLFKRRFRLRVKRLCLSDHTLVEVNHLVV